MDVIQERFKKIDLECLLEKKKLVQLEIQKGADFMIKLNEILLRINHALTELENATYDSD
jgi:hypothetical protein